MGELDDVDALELLRVQSRQPAPRQQPGPIDQDALRGYGTQARPRAAPRPQPQRAPQPSASPGPVQSADQGVQDFYLPEDQVQALPPAERDAYIAQRQRWLLDRAGREPEPQPQQALPIPQQAPAPTQEKPQNLDDIDALDMMRGTGTRPASTPTPAAPVNPNAEPDAPTWLGRRMQDIRGKQDPRYTGLPKMSTELDRLNGGPTASSDIGQLWSSLVGGSDKDLAGVQSQALGKRYIRTENDANGYPVIVFRDLDGSEKKAYPNQPGLDLGDVSREIVGALPFVGAGAGAGAVLKGAPLLGRAGGQAATMAGTAVTQDAAAVGTGVSDVDLGKTAVKAGAAAVGGFGGEVVGAGIGALVQRFITQPGYVNAATGQLTPKGAAAAQAAGVDPLLMSQEVARNFGKEMARIRDPQAAMRQVQSNQWNIPRTQGELTGDMAQLLREQSMLGPEMNAFRQRQGEAINNALVGEINPGVPGMAGQIAPARAGRPVPKDELGANIAANTSTAFKAAKKAEDAAWKQVKPIPVTPEALAELDGAVAKRTADVMVDPIVDGMSLTPAAAKMDKALAAFKAGKVPGQTEVVPNATAGDVGAMRKRLLGLKNAAQSPEDKRAANAIYNAFIDWEVVAAEKAGDITQAALARTARTHTYKLHHIFDGEKGSAAAHILEIVKKNESPEQLINGLFASPTKGQIKSGSVTAIRQLKKAYDQYLPPDAAKAAWDDIRLAYLMRISQKMGETPGPKAIASAFQNAMSEQASIVKMLYTPAEIQKMQQFRSIMVDIGRRNPNSSWSGIAVGQMFKDGFDALLNMVGWNSMTAKVVGNLAAKPIRGAYSQAQFSKATGGGQGARAPSLAPPSYGGLGGAVGSQSQQ